MEQKLIFILLLLLVLPLATAQNYEFLYNPYTAKLDRTLKLNQSGQNMSLGALDIHADGIALSVSNSTGGTVLKVNTTSGKLEIWHPSEGANDYVSIYHSNANGYVQSKSGNLMLQNADVTYQVSSSGFIGGNTLPLGTTTEEWKALYLTEDASSGAYFGLDQDWRIWNNGTTNLLRIDTGSTNAVTIVNNTGNVGIGTTSPANKLDIRQGATGGSDVAGVGAISIGSDNPYWTFRGTATSLQDLAIDRLYAGTNYEVMRIQRSTGNVGIGTTTPNSTLHVKGTTDVATLQATNVVGNRFLSFDYADGGANDYGNFQMQSSTLVLQSGTFAGSKIHFTPYNGGIYNANLGLTISNTGNVGIGTISPAMGLHVGTGSSSHSLTNVNDTFVSGKFEVDGETWFDSLTYFAGTVRINDDVNLAFGTSSDAALDWSTQQVTENTMVLGLGATANSIILTNTNIKAKDYDHPAQSNPTLFMQSATDPDTNNTQWGSIAHDTSSFVIDSGTDSITLDDSTNVAGNLNLGDNVVGEDKFRICYNGSQTILDMYSPNSSLFSCGVANDGTFSCSAISTWSCT